MAVGVLAALMVITPLSPRGEISFLLDRNKVAIISERLRVDNALYRGADNQNRPFSLTAGEAVQRSSAEGLARMDDLVARLLLDDSIARGATCCKVPALPLACRSRNTSTEVFPPNCFLFFLCFSTK